MKTKTKDTLETFLTGKSIQWPFSIKFPGMITGF